MLGFLTLLLFLLSCGIRGVYGQCAGNTEPHECNHRYLRYFLSLCDNFYSHTKYQGSGEAFPSLSVPRRGAVLSQSPASGRSSISALCCSEGLSLHLCPQSGSQTSVQGILANLVSCLTTHFPTHPLWWLWFLYFWIMRILLFELL